MQQKDITNQRFGRWTAIERIASKWKCRCECGKEKTLKLYSLTNGTSKSCGCFRRDTLRQSMIGSNNPKWKGGPKPEDYVFVRNVTLPDGSFRKRMLEHVYVMCCHLGRVLYPGETVHHKNGIRSDNDFDNLELKASSHGVGQTIPDLLTWAHELIRRYESTT